MDNIEIWKPIKEFENLYMISNFGNVYSIRNNINLKPSKDKDGYMQITLNSNGKKYTKKIHRLVCLHFLEYIVNKNEVNHIDGIKHNNNISNLEWCDRSENNKHAYSLGLKPTTEKQKESAIKNGSKYSKKVYGYINNNLIFYFKSIKEAGRVLNISDSQIGYCCKGKYKYAGKFNNQPIVWKYCQDSINNILNYDINILAGA